MTPYVPHDGAGLTIAYREPTPEQQREAKEVREMRLLLKAIAEHEAEVLLRSATFAEEAAHDHARR